MSNHTPNLTAQQARFCDEYLVSFNAYRAAVAAGYSENTAAKGELLHTPKIQEYLKMKMNQRAERLEISHDMILREYAMIAFSNMGNYYDDRGELRPMAELSERDKAAIHHLHSVNIAEPDGYVTGRITKIKLHNKMAALDRIAKHLGFFGAGEKNQESRGSESQESRAKNQDVGEENQELRFKNQDVGKENQESRCTNQDVGKENQESRCKNQDVGKENQELRCKNQDFMRETFEVDISDEMLAGRPIGSNHIIQENTVGKILTLSPLFKGVGRKESVVESLEGNAFGRIKPVVANGVLKQKASQFASGGFEYVVGDFA